MLLVLLTRANHKHMAIVEELMVIQQEEVAQRTREEVLVIRSSNKTLLMTKELT